MAALQDIEMARLSDLLERGSLSNAPEIANLVQVELGEPADLVPKDETLQSYFELLISRGR